MLPTGVRPRQLKIRTLLIGMTLALRAGHQAFLTDVHTTLTALPTEDQRRLGVIAHWPDGEHQLTYRQVEYTFDRVTCALANDTPDGTPSERLQDVLDRLLEASVQVLGEPACSSYAVDWTDQETWSLPPPKKPCHQHARRRPRGDTTPDDHDPARQRDERQPPPTPRLRRPRGILGPPPRRRSRPPRRAVLRLLPPSRHDRQRRARPTGPRTRPPHAPELLRARPATRVRARPRTDAHQTASRSPTCSPTPATATAYQRHWALPIRALGIDADLRSAPQRPRPARHPPRRDLPQRQPLLPRHPHHPARARTTAPRRQPRADRHPRPAIRRARPLQALADHPPRPRRLPPRDLPRRPRQTPLPPPASNR